MSDFLSSLRGVAARVLQGDEGAQATARENAQLRTSADYRQAASNRVSAPQGFGGLVIRDNYDPVADARQGRAFGQFAADVAPSRSVIDQVRDTALDVTTGVVGGALNLGALGASGISQYQRGLGQLTYDFGVPLAEFAEDTTGFLGSLRTQESQAAAQAYAATQGVLTGDNRQEEQEALAAGASPFVAGAQRIVRDVRDTTGNLLGQSEALGSGISQGVGSLLLGGPVAKGATAAVSTSARALSARGLMSPRLASVVAESIEQGAMTGTIAAMEAGGAYSQATNIVMGMDHAALMEDSPLYVEMLNRFGDTEQGRAQAKNQVASRAGSIAATIQAPIAAVAGRTVARFEAAPLAGTSIRGALRNIGAETIEEGTQSFSGAASSNAGVRFAADQNFDLSEGVGSGLAEGAIFGSGTAGGLSGAAYVANAPRNIVENATRAINAVVQRGAEINSRNSVNTAVQTAEAVRQAAAPVDTATPVDIDPEVNAREIAENADILESLSEQFRFSYDEYQPRNQAEADVINTMTVEDPDIFDAMTAAAQRLENEDLSPEAKIELAIFINDLQSRVTGENLSEVFKLQEKAAAGGTLAVETARILRAQEMVETNQSFNKVIQDALASTPEVTVDDLQDVATPEGQRAVQKAAIQAELTPETISPEVAERLLKHTENSPELFSRGQTIAIRATVALTQTVKAMEADAQRMGIDAPRLGEVARETQLYDHKKEGFAGPSVRGHYALVTSALRRGETEAAIAAMTSFQNFAQSMANKLVAINAAHLSRTNRQNTPQNFQAYSQINGWHQGRVEVRSQVPGSVAFAQQAGFDSGFVVDNYNKLAEQYPELGLQRIEREQLHPDLTEGPARMVAEKTLKVRDVAARVAVSEPVISDQKQPEPKTRKVDEVQENTITKTPEVKNSEERVYDRDKIKAGTNKQITDEIERLENRALFGETLSTDEQNLKVLRAELTQRDEEFLNEPSEIVSDTAAPSPASTEAVEEVAQPQAEPEVEATQETAVTIQELFPDVIKGPDGSNLLHDGFTVNGQSNTRLIGKNAMSMDAIVEAVTTVGEGVTENVVSAYRSVFGAVAGKVVPMLAARLKDARAAEFQDKTKRSQPGANRWVSYRLLNLMTETDGILGYDPLIEQANILALSDWLAQNSVANPYRDAEDIRKALGLPKDRHISSEMEAAFNGGMVITMARRSLAETLKNYLGLKAKSSVRSGFSDSVITSMAVELLDAAENAKIINKTVVGQNEETQVFVSVNKKALGIDGDGAGFANMTTLISETVLEDRTVRGYHIDEKNPASANKKQMNTDTLTTDEQRKTEKREGNVPQTVNIAFVDTVLELGKEGIIELFAEGELDENVLNVNDYRSKKGRNTAFAAAYDVVFGLIDSMGAVALEKNKDLAEVQLFRDYVFSSVNRLQQRGLYGDQGSKLVREMITPMAVTLDLTNADDLLMWQRGIGQALGAKVDKKRQANWLNDLNNTLKSETFQAALAAMKAETKPKNYIQILKDADITTPVKLHALKSYADYETATDKSKFFTHMYVEADGVTDGPTNSLLYMRLGGFDANMVRGLARGGVVFSAEPKTIADIFDPEDGDNPFGQEPLVDTYVNAADILKRTLVERIRNVVAQGAEGETQRLTIQARATLTVLDTLMDSKDFTYTVVDGKTEITIGRNMLKNPLTISLYGSSPSGIATNVAEELLRVLYARISEASAISQELIGETKGWREALFINDVDVAGDLSVRKQKMDRFWAALTTLTNSEVKKDFGAWVVQTNGKAMPALESIDPVKFTVSPQGITNLASALRAFYIDPMVDTIGEVMGTSMEGSRLIQKTSNMMSALARTAAQKVIYDSMAKHVRNGGKYSDGISPEELKKAFSKIAFLLPYMEGDLINVNVKGLEVNQFAPRDPNTGKLKEVRSSASVFNISSNSLEIDLPGLAGVGGAAKINISYGDGRMIIAASSKMKGGRGMVFDGINTNLRDAKENGKAINEAVLEVATKGTPFQDLLKPFEEAITTLDIKAFGDAEIEEIFTAVNGIFAKTKDARNDLKAQMAGLLSEMKSAALEEQARQAVFGRVHLSSDHMAAIEAPASTKGQAGREDLSQLSYQDMAKRLQALFVEELQKLEKQERTNPVSEKIEAAFAGLKDHSTGTKVVTSDKLIELLSTLRLPKDQELIIRRAVAGLSGAWRVVIGNREQANSFNKAEGINHVFKVGDHGLAAPDRKTIIVANGSSETLAHELIHAATIDKVSLYMSDPDAVDSLTRTAIGRLETLQNEWLEVVDDASALRDEATLNAIAQAKKAILSHLELGNKAAALNEFMAWNLSNQKLIRLNTSIKVESKLVDIGKKVLQVFRAMFGLPSLDMASNIRFNTMIVMRNTAPTVKSVASNIIMYHSSRSRPDLSKITNKFAMMVAQADGGYTKWLNASPAQMAIGRAQAVSDTVTQHGFKLTNEERRAFIQMIAAFRVNMVKNPTLMLKLNRYHTELLAQMNQTNMALGDPMDPDENRLARARIALLDGSIDLGASVNGVEMVVPVFAALSAVSPDVRTLFNRMQVRNKKKRVRSTNLDEAMASASNEAIDAVLDFTLGLSSDQQIGEEVEKLIASIVEQAGKEKNFLQEAASVSSNYVRIANSKVSDFISYGLGKVTQAVDYVQAMTTGTKYAVTSQLVGSPIKFTANFLNKERFDEAVEEALSYADQKETHPELRSVITTMFGNNKTNENIFILIKQGRAIIDRVRETYRRGIPKGIMDNFSRALTPLEMSHLHLVGQMDFASLIAPGMNDGNVVDLLADSALMRILQSQKAADIRRLFGANAPAILGDASDLALLLSTKKLAHGLVKRNALAIANRVGEAQVNSFNWNSPEVQAIDAYVSLLAMSQVAPSVVQSLRELAKTENKGMRYILSLMNKVRATEMERVTDALKYNVPKGYMPREELGVFKAVSRDNVNGYTKAGYRIVGVRKKGPAEELYDARTEDMVFVATDLTAPSFKQGIMRTIRSTVFGLDAATGETHNKPTAGLIRDQKTVQALTRVLRNKKAKDNTLLPLFNKDGAIYAYERVIEQAHVDNSLETQENGAIAVGQWMGRQHEEINGERINTVLIDRLTDMWERAGRQARTNEYVDLFELAKTDTVVADALNLMSERDIDRVKSAMGGKFMVRRSLYANVIGFRSMSIGDLWTGNINIQKENREAFTNFITGLLGPQAFRYLSMGETAWTNLMSDARVAIVVKSMLVPALNAAANFYQLMANGIGPVEIAKKTAEYLRETHLYAKNEMEYQRLSIELAASEGAQRPDRARRIETEMRKIEDLNKQLGIWPLIQAGEFSQITEGLSQDDMDLSRGRIWDHVSKLADKLPKAVKTAGRYAIVAKDTPLFAGLARAVSYTDFVAKAVLYDHMINVEKLDKKDALLRITNHFVNYDILDSRAMTKAEEMGVVWFWKFKLRSIQSAADLIRNNPLHTLLSSLVPGSYEAGTVMDDNGINLFLDGRFDNSIGFDNAWRAVELNPVAQVMG